MSGKIGRMPRRRLATDLELAQAYVASRWTLDDVAAYLGVEVRTVRHYRSEGRLPAPEGELLGHPLWVPQAIAAWHAARPGLGWRKRAD